MRIVDAILGISLSDHIAEQGSRAMR